MAEDKIIKSGQLTLRRIIFMALAGGVIVLMVALGGIWLYIGYWLLTAAICIPLYLIATDYGVDFEQLHANAPAGQATVIEPAVSEAAKVSPGDVRIKRRTSRPAKRRR
jgi:hypothetical protein